MSLLFSRQLTMMLHADGGMIRRVQLDRPALNVAHAVIGRPAEEAPGIAAALLPICACAHRAAATGAIEAAQDRPVTDALNRATGVLAERVANGVWRLGLDAATALGLEPRMKTVLAARTAARSLGFDPRNAGALAALRAAAASLSDIADTLRARVAAKRRDTETLRLVDRAARDPSHALVALSDCLAGRADPVLHAGRIGDVMTSRGQLSHRCTIGMDHVTSWRIDAPTDRLVMQDGPLERALTGLAHDGDPVAAARLITVLHDPCEAVIFKLAEAADA